MPRRSVVVALLAGAAAAAALLRRRREHDRERVEVAYGDGSSIALENGAPPAAELLAIARGALRVVDAGR